MHFSLASIILFITFLINLGTAIFIFIKSINKKQKYIFGTIIILIATWNLISLFTFILLDKKQIMFWNEAAIFPVIFIPSVILLYSFIFPLDKKLKVWQVLLLFLPTIIEIPFIFTKYNIKGYVGEPGPSNFITGSLYIFFSIHFCIYICWGAIKLLKSRKKINSNILKSQINYIVSGIVISAIIGILANAILPLFAISAYSMSGDLFSIIFGICTAYAITRYRFMDIKVVIKKSIIYFLFLIIVLAICLGVAVGLYFLLKNYLQIEEQVALMICIALLIIILPALQKHLKKQLDKYIKQEFIDLSVQDKEFANSLSQAHELDDLIFKVLGFIKGKIKAQNIYFLVRDIRIPELQYICQCPKDEPISFLDDLPLFINFFKQHLGPLNKEEISYLNVDDKDDKKVMKRLRNFMDANNAQIIIPLEQSGTIHGFILFPRKPDGSMYTQDEASYLANITPQVSFALDRVIFYEETMERVRREFGGRK